MKSLFIFCVPLIVTLLGCSVSKNSLKPESSFVVNATYQNWIGFSQHQTEPAERGIDLTVIMNPMPENAEPQYIIFQERKSFAPVVTTTDDQKIKIEAKIIIESDILTEVSGKSALSDRLVITKSDGTTDYIEIKSWERLPNKTI